MIANDEANRPDICDFEYAKWNVLASRKMITAERLEKICRAPGPCGRRIDEMLLAEGVPKHELLRCLSDYYGLPFTEYEEGVAIDAKLLRLVDLERLKQRLWFPLETEGDTARVVLCDPKDDALCREIKETLGVSHLRPSVALSSDIVRMIENQQDVNPDFPPSAGRTSLARLRTLLAGHRTMLARYRTSMAKGRTGLSFMRTGISCISIGLVFFRIFGIGYLSILEALLVAVGLVMTVDGLIWYAPVRKVGRNCPEYAATEPTFGTTVLASGPDGDCQHCTRTGPVAGAEQLRNGWNRLTPVMKRRFFAIDRTDFADERSLLAHYRTIMARSRTGLAFMRTGISLIGLGIALVRQFSAGPWSVLDGTLISVGFVMSIEGLYWYFPGIQAGRASFRAIRKSTKSASIWDFMFNPFYKRTSPDDLLPTLFVEGSHAPGIWGTTGLALERTLIAERRNVKSRLRTMMARSRTGLAFIRTGISIFSVGLGLLVYFGATSPVWAVFDCALMVVGSIFIGDGLYWHIPAEKIRRRFPYCFGDMEIILPDYAKPSHLWKKAVLSDEYL